LKSWAVTVALDWIVDFTDRRTDAQRCSLTHPLPVSCGFATALLPVCVQHRAINLEEEWKK
jgi:hypothetical protein